jgi:hypothetical protein
MLARLRCALTGHDWPEWQAWIHGGRGAFFRRRYCKRCGTEGVETDG